MTETITQPNNSKPNEDIILKATKGDLIAFEQILFFYEKAIFNYVYRLIGHRQNAEDLTQETFIKVYKNISRVDPKGHLSAWIYKIATNTVYDWLRKQRNQKELLIIDDPDNQFETIDPDDPYKIIEGEEDITHIESALEKLKPIYKTVILLYYQKELTYQEMADTLNVPINTIKTYVRRAKKNLADILRQQTLLQ